jgi:hypothetical protein
MGVIWFLFGLLSSSAYLAYAVLTAHFPETLTGRAITAMNFMVFVIAFVCQWGIGAVIEGFPATESGGYPPEAHAAGLWMMIGLQIACYVYFVWPMRGKNGNA